jgi:hypothetical protein
MTKEPHTDPEAQRIELQEAIVTFRQQATLGVQIAGFLAAADSLLLVAGFAQHMSSIFLVACFMPIILLVTYIEILKSAMAVGYVAMILERKLGLLATPLATIFSWRILYGTMPEVNDLPDLTEASARDAFYANSVRLGLVRAPAFALYIIFAAQVALFLIAAFSFRFM